MNSNKENAIGLLFCKSALAGLKKKYSLLVCGGESLLIFAEKTHEKTLIFLLLSTFAISFQSVAQKATSKIKSGVSTAQVSQLKYTFNLQTAAYTPLDNPTSLSGGVIWDDPTFPIPLPFPININGQAVNNLSVGGLGSLMFGTSTTSSEEEVIAPFDLDVIDRGYDSSVSLSPISYKVEGTAGSRILKVEWKEIGSYYEYISNGGILTDYISFQAWIYETTQVVEFRFGPSVINNPLLFYDAETGATIGFGTITAIAVNVNLLMGPAANPTLVLTEQTIIGTPANGTVYRFTPLGGSGSSVAEEQLSSILKAYPNPANDLLHLQLSHGQKATVILLDLSGRELKRITLTDMQNNVDISDLAAGVYTLRVQGAAGSLKIIKK